MYTLNCVPQTQHPSSSSFSCAISSSTQLHSGLHDSLATQHFIRRLKAIPPQSQMQSTPPPLRVLNSFVRGCFPKDLVLVDVPQALTGLDYLKHLGTQRRREIADAIGRLKIDKDSLNDDPAPLSALSPGMLQWMKSSEEKERKVEALYTQLDDALRRWILINELLLLPYNKHKCVALLNTLYPPVVSPPPTSKLLPPVLKSQRDDFLKHIVSVEKVGPRILRDLMAQGKAPDEENGWLSVIRMLGSYLQLANSIIRECAHIGNIEDAPARKTRTPGTVRTAGKVDSGISVGSARLTIRSTSSGEPLSPTRADRAKISPGSMASITLEKLARGLKTIGRARAEVTEMATDQSLPSPPSKKVKVLRKMRSLGAVNFHKTQAQVCRPDVLDMYSI